MRGRVEEEWRESGGRVEIEARYRLDKASE